MDSNLIQAFSISAIGIGVVFSFLILLILASQCLTQIVEWLNRTNKTNQVEQVGNEEEKIKNNDSNKIAAITAGIHQHRKKIKLESL